MTHTAFSLLVFTNFRQRPLSWTGCPVADFTALVSRDFVYLACVCVKGTEAGGRRQGQEGRPDGQPMRTKAAEAL